MSRITLAFIGLSIWCLAGCILLNDAAAAHPLELPGCEPVTTREFFPVNDAGHYLYYQWFKVGEPGTSLDGRVENGFMDAAAIHLYGGKGDALQYLDTGTVGLFRGRQNGWLVSGHRGRHTEVMGGEDAPVANNEPAITTREDWLKTKDVRAAVVEYIGGTKDGRVFGGIKEGQNGFPWKTETATANLILHDGSTLRDISDWLTPGSGCLELETETGGRAWQTLFHTVQSGTYEITFYGRNEGKGDSVPLELTWAGEPIGRVTLTPKWERLEIQFTLNETADAESEGFGVKLPANTHVWLDDFQLEADLPYASECLDFKMLDGVVAASTMDALLGQTPSTTIILLDKAYFVEAALETIPTYLERTEGVGTPAVLRLGVGYSDQEWYNLLEYLCAPYDPEIHSRLSRPYAWRRWKVHGHKAPWTESFDKVILDIGIIPGSAVGPEITIRKQLADRIQEKILPEIKWYNQADGKIEIQNGTE